MKMKTKLKELPQKIALRLLIDNLEDNNDFILLLSQWNGNERDKRAGIISLENYRMYKARISNALTEYIDDLSEDDLRNVLKAADMDLSKGDENQQNTNSININGHGNTIIQGNTDSDITIIENSKNVVSGSKIQAGGDVHIGDVIATQSNDKIADKTVDKKVVLFLASNPTQQAELNLHKEYSLIASELDESPLFELKRRFAVSKTEMNDQVDDLAPTILHFSGHGSTLDEAKIALIKEGIDLVDDTGLIFHNDAKNGSEVLNASESKKIFEGLKGLVPKLEIVLLNACHSHSQAAAISECGISAIGIDNKIMDKTAMIFAKGFYRKYAKTNNIIDAIRFGIIQANTTLHGKMDAKDFIHLYQNGQKIKL